VNFGEGNKRRERMASSGGVLVADREVGSVRLWWQVWRWPAAVFAGVLLWLALVAIAGATPLVAPTATTNACSLPPLSMPWASRCNALTAAPGHRAIRTGFTPRRP